jgi:DNA-binding NtrC family response regulator
MADILVIDDDASVAQALQRFFESEGHSTRVAASVADGLATAAAAPPDLVMMDIRMPGVDGLAGLGQLKHQDPGLCVVMMTGYGTSQTSIDAIRSGAFDYLTKPIDLAALRELTARALQARAHDDGGGPAEPPHPQLVGQAPAMLDLYKKIGRLATNDVPALFVGEHGTGKSLAIAQLHDSSARGRETLVHVDCAMPLPALESAMFADGSGTLHLSNLEALPAALQLRLHRALAESDRVPAHERLRARVVASTTADLAAAVGAGGFNRDLYAVMSLITVHLPPLRERREDLPLLIRHFIQIINAKLNRSIRGVDDQAMKRLQEHAWPGNVRELERVLTRAAILVGADVISANDIAFLTESVFVAGSDGLTSLERSVRAALHERLVDSPSGDASIYHDVVDAVETALVKEALIVTNGNQVKASELLGLNRATLRKKAPAE